MRVGVPFGAGPGAVDDEVDVVVGAAVAIDLTGVHGILLDADAGAAGAGERGDAGADVGRRGQVERGLAVGVGEAGGEVQRTRD